MDREEEEDGEQEQLGDIYNKQKIPDLCARSVGDTKLFSSHSLTLEESFILSSSQRK